MNHRSRSRIGIRSLETVTTMQSVDTLVEARWVIPVEPEGIVLEHHTVVIDDGRIGAILPQAQARSAFSAHRTVALPGHVVLPGLVNAHTHAGMTLLRGFADDLPLMRWLEKQGRPSVHGIDIGAIGAGQWAELPCRRPSASGLPSTTGMTTLTSGTGAPSMDTCLAPDSPASW